MLKYFKRPKTLQVIKNDHTSFDFVELSNFFANYSPSQDHISTQFFEEVQEQVLSASSDFHQIHSVL